MPTKTKPESPSTALVPTAPAPPPETFAPPALSEAAAGFLEVLDGDRQAPKAVPLISINHRDGGFVLPSGEVVAEVSGYPIYYFQTKKFYLKPPQPGSQGKPPDCWSADLVVPHPTAPAPQSPTCAACAMNEFGTGRDGKSKACADITWVFLLNPAFGTPPIGVVVCPPSSIRPLLGTRFQPGYFARCGAKYQVHEIVWTTFRLKAMGDQVPYCVIDPVMGPPAPLENARALARFRNEFRQAMDALRGKTAETSVEDPGS